MSETLVKHIREYVHFIIKGFEAGLYRIIKDSHPTRIKLMKSNHEPFITFFRDAHEKYYTAKVNSLVTGDDKFVTETFDNFAKICNHTQRCLLTIIANIAISVHFNLDRQKLDTTNYEIYCGSVSKEVYKVMSVINIAKLFEHTCQDPKLDKLELIPDGKRFITIDMLTSSNGAIKQLNSFGDDAKAK